MELADPAIYESGQKDRMMKTLERQRTLEREEKALMREWDELTTAIEKEES